jgi:hypothetical protein
MAMPLEQELKTFKDKKQELLRQYNGKYVLIKGDQVIGIFESEKDAIGTGIQKFGNVPFLVKKVEEVEQSQNYTSNLIQVG